MEVEIGKMLTVSGSCMASDISCVKQVHLERWALLVTTSGLPKSADVWSALWGCSGKHGGTVSMSPKFCTFAFVLIELCPFACWVLPSSPAVFQGLARSFQILLLSSHVFVVTLSLLSLGDLVSIFFSPSPKSLVKILSCTGRWANLRGLPLIHVCGLTVAIRNCSSCFPVGYTSSSAS